ncbi:MAG: HEAT repeat domain-containing protein [Deltaproteobacteria bacterium]|nr:HEAT repeat domain-containing protein [Deltaproteobacteria bacterium]
MLLPPVDLAPWRHEAERLALVPETCSRVWSATARGLQVAFEIIPVGSTEAALRVSIGLPPARENLSIGCMDHALPLVDRVLTGDQIFDANVFVRGPEPFVYGLLDAPARRDLRTLVCDRGARVEGGVLALEPWATTRIKSDEVTAVVEAMLAMAAVLARTQAQAEQAIARIWLDDPNAEVRSLYADRFAAHGAIRRVVDHARAGVPPKPLASLAPSEALALIERVGQNEDGARVVAALCEHPAHDVFLRSLHAVMRMNVTTLQTLVGEGSLSSEACERALGIVPELVVKDPSFGATLLGLLFGRLEARNVLLRARYLEAFGEAGDSSWARLVASQLDSPHAEVRDAAIYALAKIGAEESLGALEPFTTGVLRSGEVKNAARGAIAAIEARLPAAPGSVSISKDRAGALTAPDDNT